MRKREKSSDKNRHKNVSGHSEQNEPVEVHDLDHEFEELEKQSRNSLQKRIYLFFRTRQKRFSDLIKQKKDERLTLMFIPHNENKIKNYHISNLTLTIVLTALTLVIVVSSVLIINHNSTVQEVDKLKISQKDAKIQFAKIRSEIKSIGETYSDVRKNISELYSHTGGKSAGALFAQGGIEIDEKAAEAIDDKAEEIPLEIFLLNRILNDMRISQKPIDSIEKFLGKREKIIKNTPTIWPVKGSIINPYGFIRSSHLLKSYFNRGIDIAGYPGAPVVAAGPGIVSSVEKGSRWGFTVKIRHNYGYETVYSGLDRVSFAEDDKVVKGEVIGYLGYARNSLESILHYEIHIGVESVDPLPYLGYMN